MSSVDIYTDIVLRTLAARGELKAFSSLMTAETRRWSETEITIDTSFRPPDNSAVMRRIQELQAQVVEIPVRYVPMGEAPRPPASSGTVNQAAQQSTSVSSNRFGQNAATNSGANVALSNGRPGVDPQGFGGRTSPMAYQVGPAPAVAAAAQATIDTTAIGESLDRFRRIIDDTGTELFGLQTWLEKVNATGFTPAAATGGSSAAPTSTAGGPAAASGTDGFSMRGRSSAPPGGERPERNASRRTRELVAAEQDARLGRRNGVGYEGGEPAARGLPEADGAGGGPGGYGRRRPGRAGAAQQYLNAHPSLGRFFGAAGAIFGAEHLMRSATAINEAGFGTNANEQRYQQMMATNEAVRSIPLVGGTLSEGVDLGTSAWNWMKGEGFVSTRKRAEQTREKAALQIQTAKQGITSNLGAKLAGTYDQTEAIEFTRGAEKMSLEQELADDKYRVNEDNDPSGRKRGQLNASGEARKMAETKRIEAEAKRKRDDYAREQDAADKSAVITRGAMGREGDAAEKQSKLAYGRQDQLKDQLAGIDDRVAQKKVAAEKITDPREKARAEADIIAETELAKQQKIAATSEAKRQWAVEDQQIISATEEATLRASGNVYDADKEAFEAAWKAKLALEQDAGKRVILERQKVAEESARQYKLVEQARHNDQQTRVTNLNTNGRRLDASNQAADDQFNEGVLANGITDHKTGKLKGRDELNEAQRKYLDSLWRQRDATKATAAKEYKYATEDDEREARMRGQAFAGNRYGGQVDDIAARRKRELDEHKDKGPEGDRARAAINAKYNVEEAELVRGHKDDIRHNRIQGDQARLRMQGREHSADVLGLKQDLAEELRSAKGDPDLLKSIIAKRSGEATEKMMGSNRAEMHGSVADYANSYMLSTANNADGGAYNELKQIAKDLANADMSGAAGKLAEAAERFLNAPGI